MDIQKELVAEYDRETANTRKVLEAIPDNAALTKIFNQIAGGLRNCALSSRAADA